MRIDTNNQIINSLPKELNKPKEEISLKDEEGSSEPLPAVITEVSTAQIETNSNLPVISDVQYELKDVSKKGLFGWRKNK